jgi:hypothetical protein
MSPIAIMPCRLPATLNTERPVVKLIPAAIASTDDVHPVVFVEPKFAERFRQCVTAAGFELILDSGLCDVCDLTAFRFGPSTDVVEIAHWFNEILNSEHLPRACA